MEIKFPLKREWLSSPGRFPVDVPSAAVLARVSGIYIHTQNHLQKLFYSPKKKVE